MAISFFKLLYTYSAIYFCFKHDYFGIGFWIRNLEFFILDKQQQIANNSNKEKSKVQSFWKCIKRDQQLWMQSHRHTFVDEKSIKASGRCDGSPKFEVVHSD